MRRIKSRFVKSGSLKVKSAGRVLTSGCALMNSKRLDGRR